MCVYVWGVLMRERCSINPPEPRIREGPEQNLSPKSNTGCSWSKCFCGFFLLFWHTTRGDSFHRKKKPLSPSDQFGVYVIVFKGYICFFFVLFCLCLDGASVSLHCTAVALIYVTLYGGLFCTFNSCVLMECLQCVTSQ